MNHTVKKEFFSDQFVFENLEDAEKTIKMTSLLINNLIIKTFRGDMNTDLLFEVTENFYKINCNLLSALNYLEV